MLLARLVIILLIIAMSGCASTGPASDGSENSQESVDIGKLDAAGLLSRILKKSNESEQAIK